MIKIDFKKSILFFKNIWQKNDKEKINLALDWQIILGGFVFVLALAIALDIYIFWFYHKEKYLAGLEETVISDGAKIDKVLLGKILNRLEQKQRMTEENYLAPNVSDPSF